MHFMHPHRISLQESGTSRYYMHIQYLSLSMRVLQHPSMCLSSYVRRSQKALSLSSSSFVLLEPEPMCAQDVMNLRRLSCIQRAPAASGERSDLDGSMVIVLRDHESERRRPREVCDVLDFLQTSDALPPRASGRHPALCILRVGRRTSARGCVAVNDERYTFLGQLLAKTDYLVRHIAGCAW